VLGHWRDEKGKEHSGLLGYVPRELAARIAKEAPSANLVATLETLILPRKRNPPGSGFQSGFLLPNKEFFSPFKMTERESGVFRNPLCPSSRRKVLHPEKMPQFC
jgi:hypothetical protein